MELGAVQEPQGLPGQGQEMAMDQAMGPEAGAGNNPVIEALKTLGMFAVAQREQGNPAIAEWLQQGLDIMGGVGVQAPEAMPQAASPEAPTNAGPQPVGPQGAGGVPMNKQSPVM